MTLTNRNNPMRVIWARAGRRICNIAGLVLALSVSSPAQQQDLTQMSLDDLMKLQVTSVSKKEQTFFKTGASVFVITREDIRRSGMTNIPDLLRMVPGVEVARIDANSWAVSIRGFNNRYATKVLVMIDGRSVYTPGFSGVYWDQQIVPLEDIDRIEVVRGPGGTMWGADAVNGVINIITRSAQDTRGGLVSAGTGSEDSARGLVQYGGRLGKHSSYRVFGNYFNIESATLANGSSAADGWRASQGGFRWDWERDKNQVTLEGDLFRTDEGQTLTTVLRNQSYQTATFNDPVAVRSGDILGRWTHTYSNGSQASLQLYYDRFTRFDQASSAETDAAADFQYHFHAGRNDFVTGLGYRFDSLDYNGLYDFTFTPSYLTAPLYTTFLQDEISLTGTLALTLGSKFEHNSFTGFEFEPGASLVWTPNNRNTVWASAARAIRQPSWFDFNSVLDLTTIPTGNGTFADLLALGNTKMRAERMFDYEIGYRVQPSKRVSLDVTGFLSHYGDLRTMEPGGPYFTTDPAPPHLVLVNYWENLAHGRDYGVEFSGNWNVTAWWRLSPGFSFLQARLTRDPGSQDSSVEASMGDSPKHEAQLRSTIDLPHGLEWDVSAYYVGRLATGPVPSYTRLDSRLGWRVGEHTDLSVAGQNLLAPRRFEFADGLQVNPTEVERSVVARLTWHF